MSSPFAQANLRQAVNEVLQAATLPSAHGFAAVVDESGAHVALATKVGNGWQVEIDAGYSWSAHSTSAQLSVGKSW